MSQIVERHLAKLAADLATAQTALADCADHRAERCATRQTEVANAQSRGAEQGCRDRHAEERNSPTRR